ncbi:hypothetical protein [Fangia hongkongensis]|uniref:hypothetical protein n=1 Tax=Fangia hongkongensis TaxID=270495 RepID=UPI00037ED482|nr:hypothetical protein [Fangia hongkongensis]
MYSIKKDFSFLNRDDGKIVQYFHGSKEHDLKDLDNLLIKKLIDTGFIFKIDKKVKHDDESDNKKSGSSSKLNSSIKSKKGSEK